MMTVTKEDSWRLPVKSWCAELEDAARQQAANLASHPAAFHHVALMPDAHSGYGMPIGGVLALKNAVCPNAVGVDIGCGMVALRTNVPAEALADMSVRRRFQEAVKARIPVGEGRAHKAEQKWDGFERFIDEEGWAPEDIGGGWPLEIDRKNLGTLGGGNHFIELQQDCDSAEHLVWLMIHSGSRNLGHRIATYYHNRAVDMCERLHSQLPDKDLAFLPVDPGKDECSPVCSPGNAYIRHMAFALEYARESRRRMMDAAFECLCDTCSQLGVSCEEQFRHDIHHNYAAIENHFGENVWIHRKGATSARAGETGIIPGSMGTASYIVEGLGNPESFCSCSHGSGRRMSRSAACQLLTVEQCNEDMKGIVCERWGKMRRGKSAGMYDLSEAPRAYKDIEAVITAESDLVKPTVRLTPLACLKG